MTSAVAEPLLSLEECRARLEGELGKSTPALVTLKRWSGAGLLDAAKVVPPDAKRARYLYSKLLERARELSRRPVEATAGPAPAQSAAMPKSEAQASQDAAMLQPLTIPSLLAPPVSTPAKASDVLGQEIAAHVLEALRPVVSDAVRPVLAEVLQPLVAQALAATQKQLVDAVNSVDAIRKSLMLRYDAEVHNLRDQVATLKQEIERLRAQPNSTIDIARVNTHLSRLNEKIDTLLAGPGSTYE